MPQAFPNIHVTIQPILLNDFTRQWADTADDVLAAVRQVGESGWYVLGKAVASFEKNLAAHLGAGFAVGCGNGMDAIEIALRALDLPSGAPVLTTPLSAFATTLAIVRAGGVPVFVDVDETGNIDLDRCEEVLASRSDVRFMVPVHLYGHALDLDRLSQLQQRFGLQIVEDCAQAIGCSSSSRKVGSVGALATVSFYPTKNLGAIGDGGAIFGTETTPREVCAALRNYGQSARYVHDRVGLNSRLDELHAAILDRAFLPKLTSWTERRRAIASAYSRALAGSVVQPLPIPAASGSVWHLYPVRVPAARRAAFQQHLDQRGVHTAIHYPTLISDQRALSGVRFEVLGSLDRARALSSSVVSLPIHPYLTDGEVERVLEAIGDWAPS